MKIAVMQPYLFPYIGYWQLINAVDIFVIYDDVNYIQRGFINRNNILLNADKHLFTLPLQKASQGRKINEIEMLEDKKEIIKLLKTFEQAYKKAPYFDKAYDIISSCLLLEEENFANVLYNSLQIICEYLEIKTQLLKSSTIQKNNALCGQEKIIHIVKILKGDKYINAIGGKELYMPEAFQKENINLSFLQSRMIEYKQFQNEFIPFLSIVDVMMFNPQAKIQEMLHEFELIK